MSEIDPVTAPLLPEHDDDLLTRAEASAYLARYNIRLKPATLARIWSVGQEGPPCHHIRRRPFYPRGELRAWALRQRTSLRSARAPRGAAAEGRR